MIPIDGILHHDKHAILPDSAYHCRSLQKPGEHSMSKDKDERGHRKRECHKGPVPIEPTLQGADVVEKQKELQGNTCYTVRVREQLLTGLAAHIHFLKEHPQYEPSIATYSLMMSVKPPQLKPVKRNTGACTHCRDAKLVADDLLSQTLGARVTNEQQLMRDYKAHSSCGTKLGDVKLGCTSCEKCKEGACRLTAPFAKNDKEQGRSDAGVALDALRKEAMCPEAERTFACHAGKCPKETCGLQKTYVSRCSVEQSKDERMKQRQHVKVQQQETTEAADDDGDAGPQARSRKVQKRKAFVVTRFAFWALYALKILADFFLHSYVADQQNKQYNQCREKLQRGHMTVQLDFAMNYGHEHLLETTSEWFQRCQTTLLPCVVWFRVGGRLHQFNRVYMSDDTSHSNLFVQLVVEDLVKYFGVMMRDEHGIVLTHLHLWSDGCSGQFKSRYQLRWLYEAARRMFKVAVGAPIMLLVLTHNFFASCHGKGPCDALGATIKGILRRVELANVHLSDAKEAFEYLKREYEIHVEDDEKRYPRSFVFISSRTVPTERDEVREVPGIKSNHSFVASRSSVEDTISMNPLSCFCDVCIGLKDGVCESVMLKVRPESKQPAVVSYKKATRDNQQAGTYAARKGRNVLKRCVLGDWIIVWVPPEERGEIYEEEEDPSWNCHGCFRLAEIATIPADVYKDGRATRRTRAKREIVVYFAEECVKESLWQFPSTAVCNKMGSSRPTMWQECSRSEGCKCKHGVALSMEHVRMKVSNDVFVEDEEMGELGRSGRWEDSDGFEQFRLRPAEKVDLDNILKTFRETFVDQFE
jgi:hypothetical protein